jgi:hypothetical protein
MKYEATPGPWTVETHKTKYPDILLYNVLAPRGWKEEDDEYRICSVAQELDSDGDAYLISAAPDLRDELRKAHDIITQLWALGMKHDIPDSEWPYLRQSNRAKVLAKVEGKE